MIDAVNIVLTGPPGSGKSSVGSALAALLNRRFVDMDAEIEKRIGCPISEYFSSRGEQAFRDVESETCRHLSKLRGLVIAAGGGAVVRAENRLALKSSGVLVNLSADVDELLKRTSNNDDRPLVSGDLHARKTKLLSLLQDRRAIYDEIPLQVDTTGLDPVQAARVVAKTLEQNGSEITR